MFQSILVVCVGNICRSPTAERLLSTKLLKKNAHIEVSSAGVAALVGKPADETAAAVAAEHGLSLEGHVARQFSRAIGAEHSLILVMEAGHKHDITTTYPELSGKILQFDHWTGATGIADPYRRSLELHKLVFDQIDAAATAWVDKLVNGR